jgi:hypothetical protein
MLDRQQSGAGYEGTDEYVPVGADPYEIKQDAPRLALADTPPVDNQTPNQIHQLQIQQWEAESKMFTSVVKQPGQLALRLFNYPAWRVEVNGKLVATSTRDVTGQMLIPVDAGENRVYVVFTRTWDRTLGGIISAVTALVIGLLVYLRRKHPIAHVV